VVIFGAWNITLVGTDLQLILAFSAQFLRILLQLRVLADYHCNTRVYERVKIGMSKIIQIELISPIA
jgi:hypothetical protein